MLQVQAIVVEGKAFEGFAFLLIQPPPLHWLEGFSSFPLGLEKPQDPPLPFNQTCLLPTQRSYPYTLCLQSTRKDLFPAHGLHSQEQLLWSLMALLHPSLNSQPAARTNTCVCTKYPQSSPKDKKPFTDLVAHHHQAKVLLFYLAHKNLPSLSSSTLICGFRKSGVNAIGSMFMWLEHLCEPSVPPLFAACL